ncbi:MAG: adenosylcobinamide-GDP ribazoletransferase [Syntrophobacterales bacterium]|nr:adenosylcobinamide-GDP ribazoletransferase [Syntrophobacterales bacterium]
MEAFFLAISFLTRCPVPSRFLVSRNLAKSFIFFPLVGASIGGVVVVFLVVCRYVFPSSISGLLAVALLLWLTRALHLDGFADWIDGLGGGYTPERRREIMKDSRVGAFGAASIAIIIGLKAFSIASLQELEAWQGVIIAPTLGRFSMILLAWRAPSLNNHKGLGSQFIESFSWKILALSSLWLMPLLVYHPSFFLLALLITTSSVLLLRRSYIASFGIISGDLFGATCEVVETEILLAAVVFFKGAGL